MPTVPTLGPLQQVQNRPDAPQYQSDAGATPQAFDSNVATNLADLGQGATQGGDAALNIATQQQQLDNERALKQADVSLAAKISAITYGDGTAQNPGYFSQRGDNAVAQAPSTVAAIRQAHQDVMATLPNARTQSIFSTVGAERVNSATQSIGGFLDQQRLVANVGASQGRMGQAVSDAALAWNDPNVLAKSLVTLNSEVQSQAQLQGWSPDETKEKLLQAQTQIYKSVISAAGNTGNFQAAYGILKSGVDNGTLPGSALGALETDVHTAERYARFDADFAHQQAQRNAAEAQQKAVDGHWHSIFQPDGSISVPSTIASDIGKDPAIHAEVGAALIRSIAGVSGTPTTHDEATYGPGFYKQYQGVTSGQITDPMQLFTRVGPAQEGQSDAEHPNDLTAAGVDKLIAEMTSRKTPEGAAEAQMKSAVIKAASDQLTGSDPLLHLKDPQGDTQQLKFLAAFLPAWEKGKAEGLTPMQMANPDDPHYLGNLANQFTRTRAQQMADLASANQGNAHLSEVTGGTDPLAIVKAIPNIQHSPSTGKYRDPATGTMYDANGGVIK